MDKKTKQIVAGTVAGTVATAALATGVALNSNNKEATPWYDENGVVNEDNGVAVPIGPNADDPNFKPSEASIDFAVILKNSQEK